MRMAEIYEGLQHQAGHFAGMEGQIQGLLETNAKNAELVTPPTVDGLLVYFANQHGIFNALLEAIGDAKIVNSYQLLELEAQLRGDEPREKEKPKDTGLQTA